MKGNLMLILSIIALTVSNCSAKDNKDKTEPPINQLEITNVFGEWKIVSYTNLGISVMLTDEKAVKMINSKLTITKQLYFDGDEEVKNPKYVIKIITNKIWAMEPEPEEITYSSGYLTNRIITKLIKVFDKSDLYTQFELLDDGKIIKILDNKGFILEKIK